MSCLTSRVNELESALAEISSNDSLSDTIPASEFLGAHPHVAVKMREFIRTCLLLTSESGSLDPEPNPSVVDDGRSTVPGGVGGSAIC